MIKRRSKILSSLLIFSLILSFFSPVLNLNNISFAADSSSDTYRVNDYNFNSKQKMDSTNYSISGGITNGLYGSYSTNNLPLAPGLITSCGKITNSGTYTLANSLTNITGSCFIVQANNVTINGAGYSVTATLGNSSYAVIATSSPAAGSGFGTTTISNITFSNFGGGINANGNNATSGNTNGGNGGHIVIASSTLGVVTSAGGLGFGSGVTGVGGNINISNSTTGNVTGGSINITDTNLNLSNRTYTTTSIFSINYSGTLTTTSTTLSSIQNFIINGTDYGSYIGGNFPIIPSTINTCGTLYFAGTYTFGSNITGNCNIAGNGVVISGNDNTLTGNITANSYGVTLSDVNISGLVSTTGTGGVTANNTTNIGSLTLSGVLSGDGTASVGSTTINSGASVSTSSVSFVANVINNGTINSGNGVIGNTINNSVINGNFTFNGSSVNSGTVNGNAIFSASSTNTGTINGNGTFNAYTSTGGIVSISGSGNFNGVGFITGNLYDSNSNQINTWSFGGTASNNSVLKGNAIFNESSFNATTGIVQSNATFKDDSRNLGTVMGNSTVYYPVSRPISGTTNGQIAYYSYPGLYFNDSASGHGVVGKWDDLNNWWTNASSTIHSTFLPGAGDDVIVLSGNIDSSSITAYVNTIIFRSNSSNDITIIVGSSSTEAAMFTDSSVNNGTIVGNATFSNESTENNGTVTGYITRQYDSNTFTVVRDFTHNGVHWIVQAINGAVVDLTGATYSLATNIFQALSNAVFVWNNAIGTGTPNLSVSAPVSGTIIKWAPIVSWGTSNLCQYKIDNGNYNSVDCSKNGSDIPRPTSGSHTILIRSSYFGNSSEKSILFSYDNTQPVDTDCSTPLDEGTRSYYYLTSNVNNCIVATSTVVRGDNNGGGSYYTINGITSNANSNVTFQNVNATGTISGFNNITLASSTINGNLEIVGVFNSDNVSSVKNAVTATSSVINGGIFTNTLVNSGVINNGTTTPVVVSGVITNNGTINGDFVFNSSSINNSVVNGNLTLKDSSYNNGTVNGDLIFNYLTGNYNAVTFTGSTIFPGTGTTTGVIKDNRDALITTWIFRNSTVNSGRTKGLVFFNDSSSNTGTVNGVAHFSDSSTNTGTINGNVHAYNRNTSPFSGGVISGTITYYSYPNAPTFRNISGDNNWNNLSNWFAFATSSIPLERTPINGEDIVLMSASTTLVSNLANNIYITYSSSTINGANYRLTGNIYGNGAYGGNRALDFSIDNLTITGTTTATGGWGMPGVDGGDGGNIRITNSSTGVVAVDGGDPLHNGGDAGSIYIYNSLAVRDNTVLRAIGGDSVGCGFGGSGGNVTLVDSSGYDVLNHPGADSLRTVAEGGSCVTVPSGSSGTGGQIVVIGEYRPSVNNVTPVNNFNTGATGSYANPLFHKWNSDSFFFSNMSRLSPLKLADLPMSKDGYLSKWVKPILNAKIPDSLASYKNLLDYFDIKDLNGLISLKSKPLLIKTVAFPGLYMVYTSKDVQINTYLTFDYSKNLLYQTVKVGPDQKITIVLSGKSEKNKITKAWLNGREVLFKENKLIINTPMTAGVYQLKTNDTPVALSIQVVVNKNIQEITSGVVIKIKNTIVNTAIKTWSFVKKLFK